MDEKELSDVALKSAEFVMKALADKEAAAKADADKIAAAVAAGIEEYKATQEPAWKGGFATKKVTKLGLKDDEMASFMHYVRTGDTVAAKAVMVEGTDSYGGFLVPNDFHSTIQTKVNAKCWTRLAGVQQLTGSRDIMQVPAEGTSLTKWEVTAESCDYYEEEPQLDPVSITAYKWTRLIKLSEELVDDQASNLEQFLANTIADWAAQTEAYFAAVGSGSSQHGGVAKFDSLIPVTTADQATSDVITVAEVFAIAYGLNDNLRDSAVWLMNGTTESYLRQILVATPYAFGTPSIQGTGGTIGNLLGRPVFNNSGLGAYNGGESDKVCIAFFDPMAYTLYNRKGLVIRRLNELYAASGQVGILASFRQGGAITMGSHIYHFIEKDN
jgi:HK97 family phage major capsid protein